MNSHRGRLSLSHYSFRSRIHGGRTPTTEVCFQPLASQVLNQIVLTAQQIIDGQLLIDIIANCDNELLLEDYDESAKMPSPQVLDRINRITLSTEPAPGRCYLSEFPAAQKVTPSQRVRLELLTQDFEAASRDPRVQSFVGYELIKSGRENLAKAADSPHGQLAHAWDGLPISSVMTAALAFDAPAVVGPYAIDSTPSSPSTSTR